MSATSASNDNDTLDSTVPQDIELLEYPVRPAAKSPPGGLQPPQPFEAGLYPSARQEQEAEHLRTNSVRLRYWVEALRSRSAHPADRDAASKMKFSHSIQFNAVPDWSAYYIAYSNLKKLYVVSSKRLLALFIRLGLFCETWDLQCYFHVLQSSRTG